MEINWDILIIFNTLCIWASTFYLLFKFRRDFAKLQENIEEIRLILDKDKIIIVDNLEF